jgi:peptidoglycan/LPS O-acetylase OafA/YrhL
MTVRKDRIFGFDLIRCAAILFVLFAHTVFMLPLSGADKYSLMMYFGFTGVEFFFVLSGYLVGKILLELFEKRQPSAATVKYFWIRRWFRTLPAYYLTLLLYAGFYYVTAGYTPFADLLYYIHWVFLQNFFNGPPDFFIHSWSLSVEEWFYLMLPLWFLFFYRFIKRVPVLQVIIAGIVVFTMFRFIAVIIYKPDWNLGVRTIVPLRLDSLMIGVLTAYLHLHYSDKWRRYTRLCLVAGLVIFTAASVWLYSGVIIIGDNDKHFLTKTLFFTVFSLSIALWMPWLSSVRTAPNRYIGYAITHISLVSYSLYLIHELVMQVYFIVCYKLSLPNTSEVRFIGSWVVSITAATVMYWLFEKPFTNLRDRFKLKG